MTPIAYGCRRPDAAHAGGAVQRCFDWERDERLHVGRDHPASFDEDCDRRCRDVGQHIDWHPDGGPDARREKHHGGSDDQQPIA